MFPSKKSDNAVIVSSDEDLLSVYDGSKEVNYTDAKKFVNDIPMLFMNVKGVMLNVFEQKTSGFKSNLDFCEAVKAKMDTFKIPHYFHNYKYTSTLSSLLAANITLKFGETVMVIVTMVSEIAVTEYEYTENGYKELSHREYTIKVNDNPKLINQKILNSSNPKKIILVGNVISKPLMKFLRATLKSKKLIVFNELPTACPNDIEELTKWFMDKTYTRYFITPSCARQYFLDLEHDGKRFPMIKAGKYGTLLPFTKSFSLVRTAQKVVYGYAEDQNSVRSTFLEKKCHENKFTLIIDAHNFIHVEHEAIIFPEIKALPKKLDEKIAKKIPVIGIMDNLSVICVPKTNDGYEFLDAWNGLYGRDLFVSFDKKEPNICDDTFIGLPDKISSAVYDLLYIMSMPPGEIKVRESWKFTITRDCDHPVLLKFDTFDGTRKAASPAFVMAMIFKIHLQVIKKETGERPTEIGICILEKFSKDEIIRIEETMKETCKMLKIECVFVRV